MLELMKTVLKNMSHDAHYFKKELQKAREWLTEDELKELKLYLKSKIGNHSHLELDEIQF